MMKRTQAVTYGASVGAGIALAWGLLGDLSWPVLLHRAFILAIAGGWIGFLLSWLDALLPQGGEQTPSDPKKDVRP